MPCAPRSGNSLLIAALLIAKSTGGNREPNCCLWRAKGIVREEDFFISCFPSFWEGRLCCFPENTQAAMEYKDTPRNGLGEL